MNDTLINENILLSVLIVILSMILVEVAWMASSAYYSLSFFIAVGSIVVMLINILYAIVRRLITLAR